VQENLPFKSDEIVPTAPSTVSSNLINLSKSGENSNRNPFLNPNFIEEYEQATLNDTSGNYAPQISPDKTESFFTLF
jgi:hypothetical protein